MLVPDLMKRTATRSLHLVRTEAHQLQEHAQLKLRLLKSRTPWRTLRNAWKELYRGLTLLKDFKQLNYTAFSKILKKHDKETRYVPVHPCAIASLDGLQCFASDQPLALMVEVEEGFTNGFARGNRKKALQTLRPKATEISHAVSFRLGVLLGLSMALCLLLFFLIHFVQLSTSDSILSQLSPVVPIYRGLFLFILHLWCWGMNVWLFHETRVSYEFIFDIDVKTELQYPHVLQIAALLTFGWFISLDLYVSTTLLAEYWPGIVPGWFHAVLYLTILACALCPFDYFARGTRIYVVRTLWAILTTPFRGVEFKDFYTCNQLCSLVNVLNDLAYGSCYYATGSFITSEASRCKAFQSDAIWVLAFLPYFFRFLQCLKRWRDSGAKRQLYNAGKYSLSLLTTFWSSMNKHYPSGAFIPPWVACAILSSACSYMWDVKCDWGLLEFSGEAAQATEAERAKARKHLRHTAATIRPALSWYRRLVDWVPSTDSLLRRRRLLSWSAWYYWAIVSDFLMRILWVSTISPATTTWLGIPTDYFKSIVYSVEVLRRNQWNYFRLENEHLANVEKQKVVNIVPLKDSVFKKGGVAARPTDYAADAAAIDSVVSHLTDSEPPKRRRPSADPSASSSSSESQGCRVPQPIVRCAEKMVRRVSLWMARLRGGSALAEMSQRQVVDLELIATAK